MKNFNLLYNMRKEGTWDRGEDYDKMLRKLRREINKREAKANRRNTRGLNNLYVLITQLKNGSRVGEAINALIKFIDNGKKDTEVYVIVEKRGDGTERRIFIPNEVTPEFLRKDLINKTRVTNYAQVVLKINTHSLRYAYIGKLGREGRSAQSIAKITGHKTLDEILRYTQDIAARDIQKEYVDK